MEQSGITSLSCSGVFRFYFLLITLSPQSSSLSSFSAQLVCLSNKTWPQAKFNDHRQSFLPAVLALCFIAPRIQHSSHKSMSFIKFSFTRIFECFLQHRYELRYTSTASECIIYRYYCSRYYPTVSLWDFIYLCPRGSPDLETFLIFVLFAENKVPAICSDIESSLCSTITR